MTNREYVLLSLKTNLFFSRIMMEHAFFLEVGFTKENEQFRKEANFYKKQFSNALYNTVILNNKHMEDKTFNKGEFVTKYTLDSEEKTMKYTGVNIDTSITKLELDTACEFNFAVTNDIFNNVKQLNSNILQLLPKLIEFKERILDSVNKCSMFTMNYPLLISHILNEANLYNEQLLSIERGVDITKDKKKMQVFWDDKMMEHALFIRGLLDPSEKELISASNNFAITFEYLLNNSSTSLEDNYNETVKIRDFKNEANDKILNCGIKSIILPLLSDHVLREANHYLAILE